jgi:hypothetical protein
VELEVDETMWSQKRTRWWCHKKWPAMSPSLPQFRPIHIFLKHCPISASLPGKLGCVF